MLSVQQTGKKKIILAVQQNLWKFIFLGLLTLQSVKNTLKNATPPSLEECPHPVVVDAPGDDRATVRLGGVIGADADGVNVSSLVGLDPQLLDDLVDLVHLLTVESHDGSVQGPMILAQVTACQLRRLSIKKYRDDLRSSLQM